MPIYEYRCRRCDHRFELLVSRSTLPSCPACESQALEKLPSLTAPRAKSARIVANARKQAAREGLFSHYTPAERPRIKS